MKLEDKIIEQVQQWPEAKKAQLLDFIEFINSKADEKTWSDFSLSSAMRGMEDEIPLYSLKDLKESFS